MKTADNSGQSPPRDEGGIKKDQDASAPSGKGTLIEQAEHHPENRQTV